VAVLAVQLVLVALLIWAAATGFRFLSVGVPHRQPAGSGVRTTPR
jgi:hypothetical protein